jgi:hypothetical protein
MRFMFKRNRVSRKSVLAVMACVSSLLIRSVDGYKAVLQDIISGPIKKLPNFLLSYQHLPTTIVSLK